MRSLVGALVTYKVDPNLAMACGNIDAVSAATPNIKPIGIVALSTFPVISTTARDVVLT